METFSQDFRAGLHDLMRWRRDVRHFRTDPVDEALVQTCLATFNLAPSVGLSEPWRILRVSSDTARTAALENFKTANEQALAGYDGANALDQLKANNASKGQIDTAQKTLQDATAELTKATEALASANANVSRIGPMEAAFKNAMRARSGNAGRAPSPLCKHLTELLLAVQQKKRGRAAVY